MFSIGRGQSANHNSESGRWYCDGVKYGYHKHFDPAAVEKGGLHGSEWYAYAQAHFCKPPREKEEQQQNRLTESGPSTAFTGSR